MNAGTFKVGWRQRIYAVGLAKSSLLSREGGQGGRGEGKVDG